jgi:cytochrome c
MKPIYIVAIVVALGAAGWFMFSSSDKKDDSSSAGEEQTSSIKMPELSAMAQKGQKAFQANCAQCHGTNGTGTNQGPPLIHDIYNPGHHNDMAIYRAAKMGTRAHHWQFGDMPPQPQVSDEEIGTIIQFIREVQKENGIVYKEHRM